MDEEVMEMANSLPERRKMYQLDLESKTDLTIGTEAGSL